MHLYRPLILSKMKTETKKPKTTLLPLFQIYMIYRTYILVFVRQNLRHPVKFCQMKSLPFNILMLIFFWKLTFTP